MSDAGSPRNSVRSSTFLSRPQITPIGPRTRQSTLRVSHIVENNIPSRTKSMYSPLASSLDNSSPGTSTPNSPRHTMPSSMHVSTTITPLPPTPRSPVTTTSVSPSRNISRLIIPPAIHEPPHLEEFGGQNHDTQVHASPTSESISDSRSLTSVVEEESSSPVSAPAYVPDTPSAQLPDTTVPEIAEPELQTEAQDPEEPTASSQRTSSVVEPTSLLVPTEEEEPDSAVSAPAYEHEHEHENPVPVPATTEDFPTRVTPVLRPQPKLVPPPAVKFGTAPVPWKGLPLEAALWTIGSEELQTIVSRAIRNSAKESFIRLLTIDNLDTILPTELERLESLRAMTQAKYRFLVHRRTMLFQALNSTTLGQQKDGEDGVSVVSRLSTQLAETVAECDQRLEEVLKLNDQTAQINKLLDIHWASALSIALRKLNGSYARRTKDLLSAKERISHLEAELEDAWKEAEKMAQELDDYEDAIAADDTVAIIETAAIVPVPSKTPSHSPTRNSHARRSSIPMPMTPTLMAVKTVSGPSTTPSAVVSPVSPTSEAASFTFPPVAMLLKAKETDAEDVPDTVSIRSGRSTRSARSTRSHRSARDSTHTSSVHAAKKRSHRASQGSLRLGHMRKQSAAKAQIEDDPPPMPELPLHFLNNTGGASASNTQLFGPPPSPGASTTLLQHLESHAYVGPSLRRQASLDTVCTNGKRSPAVADAYRGRAADDLYVRATLQQGHDREPVFRPPNTNRINANTNAHTYGISLSSTLEDDIQVVPRTPPYNSQTFSIYDYRQLNPLAAQVVPPRPPPKDPVKTNSRIPSMWMNADAASKAQPAHNLSTQEDNFEENPGSGSEHASPSSPVQSSSLHPRSETGHEAPHLYSQFATQPQVASAVSSFPTSSERPDGQHTILNRRSTAATYNKLKGLTKRYSVSLPMFHPKSSAKSSPSNRSG